MAFVLFGIAWFLLVATIVSLILYHYWVKPATYMDRVGTQSLGPMGGLMSPEIVETPGVHRVLQLVGQALPTSPAKAGPMRRRLIAAGFRSESAMQVLYGIKAISALGMGLLAFVLLTAAHIFGAQGNLAVALLFAAGGYALPGEVLLYLVRRRRRILRESLPDALDLMVICVEAGLGLDQAMVDLSDEMRLSHPELAQEFSLVTLELRAGTRRADALRNLATRTGEEEFRKLVAILIQADRFGTSIAQALRTHSDFMRTKRRQIAEEKANKVGVKLVFPIFFFILPSMFLVTVGPALLELFIEFFPQMRATQ